MPSPTTQAAPTATPALSFSLEEFLANVHAIESHVNSTVPLLNFGLNPQFTRAFLEPRLAQPIQELVDKQINFLAFAQDHIIDSYDHFVISTLSECTDENGILDKDKIMRIVFSRSIELSTTNASAGPSPSIVLGMASPLVHPVQSVHPQSPLTHQQAVDFVRGLDRVEISSIPTENMRCSYCWNNYDDATNPGNNEPIKLRCGHIVGFDCLVESLKQVGSRCGLCRLNIVEVAAQAPQQD